MQIGETPLHLSASSGHKDMIQLLVKKHNAACDAMTLVYLLADIQISNI